MINTVIKRKKHEIDATGQSVGRIATATALILRGKNKATFVPNLDNGDSVVILNASKVKFTGKKLVQKDFHRHTMHPGGLKRTPLKKIFDQNPAEVVRRAVYGMLSKNKLRDQMMKRLIIKV